jgi:hemin uptake protein HemP
MTHKSAPSLPSTSPKAQAAAAKPRTVDSTELLGAQGVLYIRHQNEVYRLQTTRFGKLILTK